MHAAKAKALAASCCLSVLLLPIVAGCGLVDAARGCPSADDELVDKVMATARHDFEAGGPGGNPISHVEVGDAWMKDLPDDLHKFGMTELVQLDVVAWFADEKDGSQFAGVHLPAMLAVSEDHEHFIPVEFFARDVFAIDDPALDDPDYKGWTKAVDDSDVGDSLSHCFHGR